MSEAEIEGIKGDYNAAKIEEEAKLREEGKKEEAERLDKEQAKEERPRASAGAFAVGWGFTPPKLSRALR